MVRDGVLEEVLGELIDDDKFGMKVLESTAEAVNREISLALKDGGWL